jgi:hypothetical protein
VTLSEKGKVVLHALAKLAKESTLSINELRVVLALERVVARIDAHKVLRNKLIFKGGFVLLRVFDSPRFTRDLDALVVDMPKQKLLLQVKEALNVDLNDGLYFAQPEMEDLVDQGKYGGYRVRIPFQIGSLPTDSHKLKKLSRVHLDVGFGDVILGKPKRTKLTPAIEGENPISWKVYPVESIYAEKLETLVSRGSANSRAKDLFDLVVLFEEVKTSARLSTAINQTFANRKTALPASFSAYFKTLDLSILDRAWGSVELSGGKMLFASCKRRLNLVLKNIDALLAQRTKR